MFTLFHIIFLIIAAILDNILGTTFDIGGTEIPYDYLYVLYSLVVILPGLGVSVRRLHDVNKSGWFLFISLIPFIGAIWLLVLFCQEGTRGDNSYGEDPKGFLAEGDLPEATT
jgi:uncharacterized membrane protein YhaH (DUF805 family)